ncbi:hypothetical protein Lfee_1461, partial [Legionella feeleii]
MVIEPSAWKLSLKYLNTRNWTFFCLKNKQKIRLIYNRFVFILLSFETVFLEKEKQKALVKIRDHFLKPPNLRFKPRS